MISARSPLTWRPHSVAGPEDAGTVARPAGARGINCTLSIVPGGVSGPAVAIPLLALRSLTRCYLFGIGVVERHITVVAAGQHVERILDDGAVGLLAQIHLAALECGGVFHRFDHPHEQRQGICRQLLVDGAGERLPVELGAV